MKNADLTGTWLPAGPPAEPVRLDRDGTGYTATIDRPAQGRFREPLPVITAAAADTPPAAAADTPSAAAADTPSGAAVEIAGGLPALVPGDGTRVPLTRVLPPDPAEFAAWCGWYDGGGRTLLLTQFPEAYFGDPMCLAAEGDTVMRAYPAGRGQLIRADGTVIELAGEPDRRRLRLRHEHAEPAVLTRSDRYAEREVSFAAGGVTLSGTLIMPAGPGTRAPQQAAVVVHGAAGGQRDICRLLAAPLLEAGVAALIYDKRGHGRSGGQPGPTIFDQADAVCGALGLLARTPGIDPARIGLLGFSNGMWAAPMAAARHPAGVAFIAGIGSPGVTMAESEVHRRTRVLRDAGIAEPARQAVAAAWRCIFRIAAAGRATSALTAQLAATLAELSAVPGLDRYQPPDYVRNNPMLSPVPPSGPVDDLVEMLAGEPDPELGYDPVTDYRRLRCPVFLQYGSMDISVPADISARRIGEALRAADAPEPEIRIYPGLEHLLTVIPDEVTGITPEEAAYLFHRFRYGPGVRADLTRWLRVTTGS
jgi:pimeloyl-ACP methyl ester carboxylesterase